MPGLSGPARHPFIAGWGFSFGTVRRLLMRLRLPSRFTWNPLLPASPSDSPGRARGRWARCVPRCWPIPCSGLSWPLRCRRVVVSGSESLAGFPVPSPLRLSAFILFFLGLCWRCPGRFPMPMRRRRTSRPGPAPTSRPPHHCCGFSAWLWASMPPQARLRGQRAGLAIIVRTLSGSFTSFWLASTQQRCTSPSTNSLPSFWRYTSCWKMAR